MSEDETKQDVEVEIFKDDDIDDSIDDDDDDISDDECVPNSDD